MNISNLSRNFTTKRAAGQPAAPAKTESAAVQSAAPQDSAELNFDASPMSNRALDLLAASADEAAKLKGNIGDHFEGEIIIRTKPGFGLASGSVVEDFGMSVLDEFDAPSGIHKSEVGDFLHLKLPAGLTTEEAMAALAKDERVEFAEPNSIFPFPETPATAGDAVNSLADSPDDPKFGQLFGLHNDGQTGGTADADIDAPEAWAIQPGKDQGPNVPILALLDSGVDVNHPDIKGNLWTNPGEIPGDGIDNDNNGVVDDVHGFNAVDNLGDPVDDVGHGTHCAGTIGAQGNNGIGVVGVNQEANIMAIKIGGRRGIPATGIIRGMQYATKMGARITSNSWGGSRPNEAIEAVFRESPALHIIAAGNSGSNNDARPQYPANYDLPNNLSIAATDHNDNLARFSCYGENTVDLAAPGVSIMSTVPNGGYGSKSGTSMATPHAAGAALLVATQFPEISNEELKERLMGGTDKLAGLEGKMVSGGRLNVYNSLTMEVGGEG